MRRHRKPITIVALALLILSTAAYGPPACDRSKQPKTVADILVGAGNAKRSLRERDRQQPGSGISAQTDYDISYQLAEANRAYRAFVTDELQRLAATGATGPDPNARSAALKQLATHLKALNDPSVLGIKSENARKVWREAIAGIGTVIEGIELLGGGN